MEIFQTIWTALTTPNEELIKILSIPLAFVEMTVIMLLFTSVLNIPSTKKQKIIYVTITTVWTVISNQILPKEYTVFINLLVLPVSVYFIFKTSLLNCILSLIIPSLIMALLDSMIAKICLLVFNFSMESVQVIPLYRITIAISIYLIMYLIYKFFQHSKINLSVLDNMDKKSKILFVIIFVLGCISIATQFYLIGYYNKTLPIFITFLSLITLIAYFFTSMFSLMKTNQLQITEQSLEEAQLYNKSLKILHDNVRAFKHDFSNIVQAIGRIC